MPLQLLLLDLVTFNQTSSHDYGISIKDGDSGQSGYIQFYDNDSSNYTKLQGAATINSDYTLTLQLITDGSSGQFLKTDGSGNLVFASSTNTFNADSGASTDTSSFTLTGGTGISTSITNDVCTFDIDSTVTTLTGTQTLTNKTLTAAKFVNNGYIADSNGNELVVFGETTSAVGFFKNYKFGNWWQCNINSVGDDTNINIDITPKG